LGGHLAYLERRGLRGRAPARLVVSCLSAVFFGSTVLIPVARAAEPCAPAVAEVVSVEGAVEVQREGETRWQPAQLGDPLCLGDIVRTGRVSRARPLAVEEYRFVREQTDKPVKVAEHCFGCTAGQGSSCGGAL